MRWSRRKRDFLGNGRRRWRNRRKKRRNETWRRSEPKVHPGVTPIVQDQGTVSLLLLKSTSRIVEGRWIYTEKDNCQRSTRHVAHHRLPSNSGRQLHSRGNFLEVRVFFSDGVNVIMNVSCSVPILSCTVWNIAV